MKYNRTALNGKSKVLSFRKFFFVLLLVLLTIDYGLWTLAFAQVEDLSLRSPAEFKKFEENIPSPIEVKNLPNFPRNYSKKSTLPRISTSIATIPLDTRLRIVVDSPVNAKTTMINEYFKAHIVEDFYIPTEPPQLIVPKGSWVRGRVSFIKKPNIFSMVGKIGLHLDNLTTPLGEVTLLDAELDLQQGIVNENGLLDPMSDFGTKALVPTQGLIDITKVKMISIDTFGTPVIGTLVAGPLIALFSEGDNITLGRGQELQIVLKRDIQLGIN